MFKAKFPTISSFFVALSIYTFIIIILFINLTMFTEPAKRYTDDKDAFIDILVPDQKEEKNELKAPEQKEEIKKEEKQQEEKKEQPKPQTTNKPVIPDEPLPTPTLPPEPKEQKQPEPKPIPQITEEAQEIAKDEPKEQKPDIKNLFSDIDTSKLKPSEKPKEQKTQSRLKNEQSEQKPSTAASDIIKSLKLDKTASTPKEQKTGIYNPLLGAITKQIERRWRSYKANTADVAEISVTIDGSGNFSYKILKLPYNENFNKKVQECLEILSNEKFPFSPNGTPITLNLKLEDKLETQ
ncbi:hypothetical protein CR66_04555 [Campylobacter mucosalis]|nr:hypothetical protein CR66_04555 [Campylobacter mucosalis]QKF63537.1 Tol-Pal system subunit TolA [Campylobacter mucosalis]